MEENMIKAALLNPYAVGGALSDPSGRGFYGREDIFQFVRSGLAVEQRGPILLYGQRRIGKSSILRQLPNHLPSDLVCVYFDLQGKASMELDQVLYGLARAIAERLKLSKPTREEATEETFQGQFLVRASHALEGQLQRLVLLFDEFDVVDEKLVEANVAARRFIGYLSDLNAAQPQIGCILVVGRKTEELSAGFNAALLKNSIQHKIGQLEEKDCSRLIEELAKGYLQFDDEALRAIYAITAGHPFCTQVLCNSIWSRYVNEVAKFPIPITEDSVMQTVPLAVERGTTGLNWSFDGITSPTQRLFLSAMAGELGSPTAKPVPMTAIEHILRSRRIGVDRVELARAPQELEQWNIIIKSDDGFRFAVPMIGLWIRKERPLEQLMSEARFSNPQAYQYYELASQAHKKGDLDRAILDYRGAVNANPVFLEAYKGLAEALIRSKGADGLDEAIEINERILEIDPNESPVTLLDLLSRRLDEPATVDLHLKRFDRIGQLEPDGHMFSRARRQLEQIAFSLMDQHAYDEAGQVFHKLNDAYMVQKARSRRVRFRELLSLWMACAALPFGTILLGLSLYPNLVTGMRAGSLFLAFVGGSALSVVMSNMQFPRKAPVVGARQSTQVRQEAIGDGEGGSGKKAETRSGWLIPDPYAVGIGLLVAAGFYFLGNEIVWWQLLATFASPPYTAMYRRGIFNEQQSAPKTATKKTIGASSKVSNHDS
jgi:tetratricopeptide (TPR) repeat protein